MGITTGTKNGGELSNESEQAGIGGVASSNAGALGAVAYSMARAV